MMNQNSKIAYCIPTYNRPAVVQDILEKTLDIYQKYQIDVYIYDSSEGDDIKDIVTSLNYSGYSNLYYIRLASSICVDDKLLLIFSGYGQKKQYDYIWPAKDRAYFLEETVRAVVQTSQNGYDAIFLATGIYPWEMKTPVTQDKVYDNPALFFDDWAWLATSLETTLFRVDTLLQAVDIKQFKEQYFINGRNDFDHLMILFIGLAKLVTPLVMVLNGTHSQVQASMMARSTWFKEALRIWAWHWPAAIKALPDCYNRYKSKVIKQATMVPWLLGSHSNLIQLKRMGAFTWETFEPYQSVWNEVSDITVEDVRLILEERYQELADCISKSMQKLFVEGEYETASVILWVNEWLKLYIGEKDYGSIRACIQLYKMELDRGDSYTFFHGITCMEDLLEKYQTCKFLLRRLEYEIAEDTRDDILCCIRQQNLTFTELATIMTIVCVDQRKVYGELSKLYERYLAGKETEHE